MATGGHGKVLWLTDKRKISDKQKYAMKFTLQKHRLQIGSFLFYYAEDQEALDKIILQFKPKILVCNSDHLIELFAGKKTNIFQCRGGIYRYQNKYDVLVMDEPAHWHTIKLKWAGKTVTLPGQWIFVHDIGKLSRWLYNEQRKQPRFDYQIVNSLDGLVACRDYLLSCIAIAEDLETHPGKIACIGFAGIDSSGDVRNYIIPFYNPFKSGGRHWATQELEELTWDIVGQINKSPVPKIFQNGALYDSSYLIRYHIPVRAFFCDTMHLFHSMFCEIPKKINFIASLVLDFYRYWKDEAKGETSEGKKAEHNGRFRDEFALDRYWRYCALDCYNTLLCARLLLQMIKTKPWALKNYAQEFALQVGPFNQMTMHGMRFSKSRRDYFHQVWKKEYETAREIFNTSSGKMDLNPNSPKHMAFLIYQVLGAQKPKLAGKAASQTKSEFPTGEPILNMIKDNQHPFFGYIIDKLLETKKPLNKISKWIEKKSLEAVNIGENGRFYYTISAAGTETGRASGSKHPFWYGTNPQNIEIVLRDMMLADEGRILFEADYSQSDAKFVAYESQDPAYIRTMESGKDTHSIHAAHFFKPRKFEEILEGVAKESKAGIEGFYTHPTQGIRPITKRIVHGANFDMAGFTLFMLMRKAAVLAAALAKGHQNIGAWDLKKYINFCQSLIDSFFVLYPRVPIWKKEEMVRAKRNNNLITVSGGRTRLFFGDLLNDPAAQREAVAYFGQGGTAGNINRVCNRLYYDRDLQNFNILLITQTHDSILTSLPVNNFDACAQKILTIMQEPVMVKGKPVSVAADAKIGLSWGKGMIKYKPGITTYADLVAAQKKLPFGD